VRPDTPIQFTLIGLPGIGLSPTDLDWEGSAEADKYVLVSCAVYARIRSLPAEDSERTMKLTTGVKSSFGAGRELLAHRDAYRPVARN
jgi:hypothetical protein